MEPKKVKRKFGFTFTEVVVSISIITVALLGAIPCQYYCTLDAKKADEKNTAIRIGTMILENWKASGAKIDDTYNPEAYFQSSLCSFNYEPSSGGTTEDWGGIPVGCCTVKFTDSITYEAKLYYKQQYDQEYDVTNPIGRNRILNVFVRWKFRTADAGYQTVRVTTYADVGD